MSLAIVGRVGVDDESAGLGRGNRVAATIARATPCTAGAGVALG
ncbi:hypothetical protein [Massilia genomosp. 1]|nr:hypothetical protein [Massilia genomosp. 1]